MYRKMEDNKIRKQYNAMLRGKKNIYKEIKFNLVKGTELRLKRTHPHKSYEFICNYVQLACLLNDHQTLEKLIGNGINPHKKLVIKRAVDQHSVFELDTIGMDIQEYSNYEITASLECIRVMAENNVNPTYDFVCKNVDRYNILSVLSKSVHWKLSWWVWIYEDTKRRNVRDLCVQNMDIYYLKKTVEGDDVPVASLFTKEDWTAYFLTDKTVELYRIGEYKLKTPYHKIYQMQNWVILKKHFEDTRIIPLRATDMVTGYI